MTPLVSILIPAYNTERWVGQAIESALAQTWPNKEIILVDDGSTDGTLNVAQRFESANVKILAQVNQGASAARNKAFRASTGDFIQFLDADDLLSAEKIEAQVDVLQDHPPGYLAVCATMYFYDGMPPAQGYLLDDGWPMVDTDDPLNWLIDLLGPDGRGGTVHPGAWLVPRSVAQQAGAWDETLSLDDDGEYFARVVLASSGIRRSAKGLSHYRKHRTESNLSSKASEPFQWSAIHAIDSRAKHILSHTDSARAKRALAGAYMNRAVFAYPEYPAITEAALHRVQELGGTDYLPALGGRQIEWVRRLFGWRVARRISRAYRSCVSSVGKMQRHQ
jgi:glycosyltransferase involved in cell wall biosynthesis